MLPDREKFQGTSNTFNYFVIHLFSTGFLLPKHVLICGNTTINLAEENKNLAEIIEENKNILIFKLPHYVYELNTIKLIFELSGHCLRQSNARHISRQMKANNFFLLECVEFLEKVSHEDIIR